MDLDTGMGGPHEIKSAANNGRTPAIEWHRRLHGLPIGRGGSQQLDIGTDDPNGVAVPETPKSLIPASGPIEIGKALHLVSGRSSTDIRSAVEHHHLKSVLQNVT